MSNDIMDPHQFISDLDAGSFEQKVAAALKDVSWGVVSNDKVGQVVITLDIKQLGSSHQVMVTHTLKYKNPTPHGEFTETDKGSTPMHVGPAGMTLWPDKQDDMFGKDYGRQEEQEA